MNGLRNATICPQKYPLECYWEQDPWMKRRCETFALSFKPYQKDPTSELKVDLLKTLENFQQVVSMSIQ